jgi:hypothetical protein
MAYQCKSCKKVSRKKKKKALGDMLKKHRCMGCGSYDFIEIDDTPDLLYDFEELVFYFMEDSVMEEGGVTYPEEEPETYAEETPDNPVEERVAVPHNDSVFPSVFNADSIGIESTPVQEDDPSRYGSSSSGGSSSDYSSGDSYSSSDCDSSCDCGGCD